MRIQILLSVVALHVANLARGVVSYDQPYDFKQSVKIFSAKSFQAIAEYETGNFVYSPVGASITLTMMAFGAGGRTETQMRSGLGLPFDDVETKNEIMAILSDMQSTDDYELHLASMMFYNASYIAKDEFVNMTRFVFGSRALKLDLHNYLEAIQDINRWSVRETNRHITKVFSPGVIDEDTKVLLASVAYFKGKWKVPFESDRTRPREFYINPTTSQKVETMFVSGHFRYGKLPEADATFVEIPYKVPDYSNTMSMYVILPNERDELGELIRNFHKIDEYRLLGSTPTDINIYLPKFQVNGSINFRKPLDTLGFEDMHSWIADFRNIVDEQSFTVKSFVQNVFIKVDEDGDPKTAVRSFDLRSQMALQKFRVNHPFVCVIMREDGIPLFIAIIKDPRIAILTREGTSELDRLFAW